MTEPSAEYLETLLRFHEVEISGDAYFRCLAKRANDAKARENYNLLAEVEVYTAGVIAPLIDKYELPPRCAGELHDLGEKHAGQHSHFDWSDFVSYMNKCFPLYVDEFLALEKIAQDEDLPLLRVLTNHEISVVEFGKMEADVNPNSMAPLILFLKNGTLR